MSPLFLLVCGVFALRAWDFLWSVIKGATCGTDGERENHALNFRRFCLAKVCCCGECAREYTKVPVREPPHAKSASFVRREDTLIQHLKDNLDLDTSIAEMRAQALMKAGINTPTKFNTLTPAQLKSEYDFRSADVIMLLVATTAATATPVTTSTPGSGSSVGLDLAVRVQGGAMKIPILLDNGSTFMLDVDEAQTLRQIKDTIAEIERTGLDRKRHTTPELEFAIGRIVWVRDGDTSAVPWIRGRVEGHDESSGKPLVRAVRGRMRSHPSFSLEHGHKGEECSFWSVEESARPRVWEHVRKGPPGFTVEQLVRRGSSWAAACDGNDYSYLGAFVRGLFKLLFWHTLQVGLYLYVFLDAIPKLELAQRVLGCCVLAREMLYLLAIVACVAVNPAFLLVDVGASFRDQGVNGGSSFLYCYVLAPEKYMAFALLGEGGLDRRRLSFIVVANVVPLLDLCGVGALGAGIGAGGMPPELAVGYIATVLGLLYVPFSSVCLLRKTGDRKRAVQGLGFVICCMLPTFVVPLVALSVISSITDRFFPQS
eukprot:COSAG06_NODE_2714_length_6403_cov_23.366593_4_plen_542_part_00